MGERRDDAKRTGIAEEGVEPAPALEDRGAQPVDGVELAQVQRHECRGAALATDRVVGLLETAHRARDADDMRPGRTESNGGGASDAPRGAGNERYAI